VCVCIKNTNTFILSSLFCRYTEQSILADHYFPPLNGLRSLEEEGFGCYTYWRLDPGQISLEDIEGLSSAFQA
jgi:hypothetical protein